MPNIQKRLCRNCGELKNLDDFYKQGGGRGDYETICKKCKYEQTRTNYHKKPEQYRAYHQKWKLENNWKDYSRAYYFRNKASILAKSKQDPEYLAKKNVRWHKRRARVRGNGGTHTLAEWENLKGQYDNKCAICKEAKKLTKDHVLPIHLGGSNAIDNIQPLCQSCNSRKGRMPPAKLH